MEGRCSDANINESNKAIYASACSPSFLSGRIRYLRICSDGVTYKAATNINGINCVHIIFQTKLFLKGNAAVNFTHRSHQPGESTLCYTFNPYV